MRFDGENLEAVLKAHQRWIETGGEDDADRADFSGCDLRYRVIAGCGLYGANFRGADLRGASFFLSDLQRADLTGALIWHTDFYLAKLRGAVNVPFIPQMIPDTGSFIGWKRVQMGDHKGHWPGSVIAKLLIPEDARRLTLPDGQCRASKVKVLELQRIDGTILPPEAEALSLKDGKTRWRAGETVEAKDFSSELYNEWTPGIYFYLDRRCAVEYLCYGSDRDGNPVPVTHDKMLSAGVTAGSPPDVLYDHEGQEA